MQARSAGSRTRGVALRLLAAAEDPSKRLPLLSESVDLLESCGDRFQLAHAIAQLSHTHHVLGSHARAQMELAARRSAWPNTVVRSHCTVHFCARASTSA